MITPNFKLTQDAKYLYVTVKAPMAKIKETQIHFDGEMFLFYSKPYYLRLNLPAKLAVQDGSEKIEWKVDENEFLIIVEKENEGEHFEDLNMLTKLLTQPKHDKSRLIPKIEVMDQMTSVENRSEQEEENEEIDWYIDQNEWREKDEKTILGEKYGFANRYSDVLKRIEEELCDLLDVKQPESKSNQERKALRKKQDLEKFDEQHYWFDLFEQREAIEEIIHYKAAWEPIITGLIQFDEDETFKLKNMPKREYLLTKKEKFHLLLGLVDILFAYAYDVRTTEGEHNCESGWTITKLSSTLSWLEVFSNLPEALASSIQRALVYPLYRNWNLSLKIISDVHNILVRGRSFVIKCLLDIHKIFNESGDLRYILNDLYITDYCVWLQSVKEKTFISLADAIKRTQITKEMIDLDLKLIEKAAEMALTENENEIAAGLSSNVNGLSINCDKLA